MIEFPSCAPSVASGDGRLRVLHVGKYYTPYLGGIETHLQVLCEQLHQHVNLRVVVANNSRRTERACVNGVNLTRVGTLVNVSAAPICPGMVQAIRRADADVVHLHLPNPTAVLAYLASGRRGPLVVSYHSDVVRQKVLGPVFEPVLHRLMARCDAAIAATPNYVESSPVLRAYRDRCHVIPYGIPVDRFARCSPAAVQEIRSRYGPRLVLGVGRLVYYKGFEYLLAAMREVDGHLLLIGDGPLRAQLSERAVQLGVAERVSFLGRVDDAAPYYHAADLFVLPSVARSEAFGIVQLEAMACGTPVINTRLDSGVPFVSLDGVSGLTVAPANAGELANAIRRVLDDAVLRARLSTAALERVRQEFSQEVMTERMLSLYRSVAGAPANAHQLVVPPAPRLSRSVSL